MKKYIFTTSSDVRYAETDKTGFVHYNNYSLYCEDAMSDALKVLEIPRCLLERDYDIGLLVTKYNIEFALSNIWQGLSFGDRCKIKVFICKLSSTKIIFLYELYTLGHNLIGKASTELMFMNVKTNELINCPMAIFKKLKNYKEKKP